MYTEKRRQARLKKTIPIELGFVALESKSKGTGLPAVTEDVSPRGLCFTCGRDIPAGSHIQIKVEIEHKGSFKGSVQHGAIVRWSQKDPHTGIYRIGVEFVETPSNEQRKWNEHMQFRSEPFY